MQCNVYATFIDKAVYHSGCITQALVSFKKYMPPPLPYFKVNIWPLPLPHFVSIFFPYLWSFRWPNYIVTLLRYFSFRLFKGLLYIWEEMIMMALLHMAGLENSECIWKIQRKPEVAVSVSMTEIFIKPRSLTILVQFVWGWPGRYI
jgi:hypothetical protein